MFYKGDVQSGIAKAVQESKFVACFVTGIYTPSTRVLWLTRCPDDGKESRIWENEFLQEEAVSPFQPIVIYESLS